MTDYLTWLWAERRWIGAGVLLCAFSGFGQTFFVSLSNTALRAEFDLTHGDLGGLYALATAPSAVILLELGKIADRVPARAAAMITISGLVLACLFMANAVAIWMLFLSYLGLRLFGQGMMGHVAMTLTGRWYERNRGKAVSVVTLGFPFSEAITPVVAVAAISLAGYRSLWWGAALTLLVVTAPILFALLSRERTPRPRKGDRVPEGAAHSGRQWRRADVLQEPAFWALLFGVLSPPFMMTCLFFHQLHLVELKGWTPALFASGFTVFAITQVVSSLRAGLIIDARSARSLLPLYLLPMAAGLCLPFLFDGSWVIFAVMILLGLTGGVAQAVMGALWPELFGVQYLGEIRALAYSAMVASSAASPFITGYLIDAGIAFPLQLGVMGGYCLLASALMGLIQPRLAAITGPKDTESTL